MQTTNNSNAVLIQGCTLADIEAMVSRVSRGRGN